MPNNVSTTHKFAFQNFHKLHRHKKKSGLYFRPDPPIFMYFEALNPNLKSV